jgi:hypothetical protein
MVVKTRGSEIKPSIAASIRRFLTQKPVQRQTIASFLSKEKYRAKFETLKENMVSKKMLTDAKITKSDTFFRFTVEARADVLRTSANI